MEELDIMLKKLGYKFSEEQLLELFNSMDIDGGGDINFLEFLSNAPGWLVREDENAAPVKKEEAPIPITPRNGGKKGLNGVQFGVRRSFGLNCCRYF